MNLKELKAAISPLKATGPDDLAVTGLAYDSRQVKPGDAFFALPGAKNDGLIYAPAAVAAGAGVVVSQDEFRSPGPAHLQVADARLALALAAETFYGHPGRKLRLVGVTGTNGKTTTTYLLEAILRAAGDKVGVIGTVEFRLGGTIIPAPLTTPQSLDISRMLANFSAEGGRTVILEASSHALDQRRVAALNFAAAAFTNLTRDHLDYHPDMEAYYEAKRRLFFDFLPRPKAAVNLEDPFGRRLAAELGDEALIFGLCPEAAVRAEGMVVDGAGIRGEIVTPAGRIEISSPLLGWPNVQNMLAAAALAHLLEVDPVFIRAGLASLGRVPGRLENVGQPFGRRVLVDYSHTPEAMRNALAAARAITPGRLITVYGCGGDRDKGKRPLMGRAAAEFSEFVVATSDNPRSEDPEAILDQTVAGLLEAGFTPVEPFPGIWPEGCDHFSRLADRISAIDLAVSLCGPEDTVVICGKGHENYQIVGNKRLHLDDREEAVKSLEKWRRSHDSER